jgi:hypothetical protein
MRSYYSNTFLIRSPFDMTLTVNTTNQGNKVLLIENQDQDWVNKYLINRLSENQTHTMYGLMFQYLFYSKKSLVMESKPASLTHTDFLKNNLFIPGEYDISKWIRPVECVFEITDDTKTAVIKRGEPLYYIRFQTDKKINLIRSQPGDKLFEITSACVNLKKLKPNLSLEENYTIAKPWFKKYQNRLFEKSKSKCPLHFWK